jgi:hypothetical protein
MFEAFARHPGPDAPTWVRGTWEIFTRFLVAYVSRAGNRPAMVVKQVGSHRLPPARTSGRAQGWETLPGGN